MIKRFMILDRYSDDDIPLFANVCYIDDYWIEKQAKILYKFKYFYLVFIKSFDLKQ